MLSRFRGGDGGWLFCALSPSPGCLQSFVRFFFFFKVPAGIRTFAPCLLAPYAQSVLVQGVRGRRQGYSSLRSTDARAGEGSGEVGQSHGLRHGLVLDRLDLGSVCWDSSTVGGGGVTQERLECAFLAEVIPVQRAAPPPSNVLGWLLLTDPK